jgi:hypothetical protein
LVRMRSPRQRFTRRQCPAMQKSPVLPAQSFQTFWKWFVDNEDELFNFERDQDVVFDALSDALHLVSEQLTFEFGPKEDGRREFVISADGNRPASTAGR